MGYLLLVTSCLGCLCDSAVARYNGPLGTNNKKSVAKTFHTEVKTSEILLNDGNRVVLRKSLLVVSTNKSCERRFAYSI